MNCLNKIKLLALLISLLITFNGCDNSVTQKSEEVTSAAGKNSSSESVDANSIKLSLNLSFRKQSISEEKMLESNLGNYFRNIVSIDKKLEPSEELNLQDLQPNGIFGLYINSSDLFELSNSDGLLFSSKSLLMEKCSFIDLKVKNPTSKTIHLTGLVAGE